MLRSTINLRSEAVPALTEELLQVLVSSGGGPEEDQHEPIEHGEGTQPDPHPQHEVSLLLHRRGSSTGAPSSRSLRVPAPSDAHLREGPHRYLQWRTNHAFCRFVIGLGNRNDCGVAVLRAVPVSPPAVSPWASFAIPAVGGIRSGWPVRPSTPTSLTRGRPPASGSRPLAAGPSGG